MWMNIFDNADSDNSLIYLLTRTLVILKNADIQREREREIIIALWILKLLCHVSFQLS